MSSGGGAGLAAFVIFGGLYLLVGGGGETAPRQSSRADYPVSEASYEGLGSSDSDASFDTDALEDARADAESDLRAMTYQDVGDIGACTIDCTGHDAGYQWAIDNDITDPNQCYGNSYSFEEGCREYGEQIERRAEEAVEDAADDGDYDYDY